MFDVVLIIIGLIQIGLALFAPDQLRAYPGSTRTRRTLGLVSGTVIVILGAVLVAT